MCRHTRWKIGWASTVLITALPVNMCLMCVKAVLHKGDWRSSIDQYIVVGVLHTLGKEANVRAFLQNPCHLTHSQMHSQTRTTLAQLLHAQNTHKERWKLAMSSIVVSSVAYHSQHKGSLGSIARCKAYSYKLPHLTCQPIWMVVQGKEHCIHTWHTVLGIYLHTVLYSFTARFIIELCGNCYYSLSKASTAHSLGTDSKGRTMSSRHPPHQLIDYIVPLDCPPTSLYYTWGCRCTAAW